jgi:hypothetical protein
MVKIKVKVKIKVGDQQLKTCHHRTVDTPIILSGRWRNIIEDQTATDPRNQISISRETNPVLTPSWKKIDETISNRGNPTPIDKSVTHLKNTATRVKDSVLFFHQQRRCAHRLQELRAPTQPSQIPGEYHTEYSDPG